MAVPACDLEIGYSEREKRKEQEINFLDSIKDIDKYFKKESSIYQIMDEINKEHGSEYTEEESIFNCLTMWDFVNYIKRRFKDKIKFYEYTDIRVYSNDITAE